MSSFANTVAISALTGRGLEDLLLRVEETVEDHMVYVDVLIPYERGELTGLFHQRGRIEQEAYTETGTHIVGRIPCGLADRFRQLEEAA